MPSNDLRTLAKKYIWWKTPDEAIKTPQRVIAQVMNMGDFFDSQALAAQVGDEVLRDVLPMQKPDNSTPIRGIIGITALAIGNPSILIFSQISLWPKARFWRLSPLLRDQRCCWMSPIH